MSRNTIRSLLCLSLAASLVGCSGSNSSDEPEADNSGNSIATPSEAETMSTSTETGTMSTATVFDPIDEGLIGPLGGSGINNEYAQFDDSPFANISFGQGYFYLEDFEDKVLEHPGASASTGNFVSLEFGEGFHDSVDADDGLIDGNSLSGESWFHAVSTTGVVWSFDAQQLNGQLPTHVGIVWTDGRIQTTFEAFDAGGQSLGTIVAEHHDGSFNGETGDDRFYGVVNYAGVSAIKVSNDYRLTGIELDHLQWGYLPAELR
ncbi:MAG: hypothetical protein KTR35_20395 [Gammaproteobacteria bacterium]|nr:hypothetical protein [Gammaproteobacteria bacterium]